ncbi:thioredoxin family protein [Thermogladius sp. 4427co]|uniref:thioredoxin family protein n=1 Tax=Thermogladius sp. 4427co TaxID=3450718 RepID=UPI003F79CACF
MSIELTSREELDRALSNDEPVIIEYYDPNNSLSNFFSEVVKELSKRADSRLLFCKINIKSHPELAEGVEKAPVLRVFYKREIIFEQKGCFRNFELDLMVLRRGIRSVFEKINLRFRV